MERNIDIEEHKKRSNKTIKLEKKLQLQRKIT